MWWSRTLLVVLIAALGPAGCGFRPMYGEQAERKSPTASELAQVRVGAIDDRMGQQLRTMLVQRITPGGEPGRPRYVLAVKVTESTSAVTSDQSGAAALGNKTVTASFSLTAAERELSKTNFAGSARSITSYRYYGPRYGTVATERDAEQRALSELAENISTQLSAYFASQAAGFRPELRQ
jgi:LPS-assembly lipoprotein